MTYLVLTAARGTGLNSSAMNRIGQNVNVRGYYFLYIVFIIIIMFVYILYVTLTVLSSEELCTCREKT